MMDYVIDLMKTCNWQTIVGMFAISWYFTHEIRKDMKDQVQRIDRLYVMFVDLLKEGKK